MIRQRQTHAKCLFGFVLLLACASRGAELQFNRDIRPILSENCLRCHGPDKNQRKAKLRLDVREVALEKEAFVPGKPDDSALVKRIFSKDDEEVMPPPSLGKTLTAEQKDKLKQWITEGAKYEPHWSYITPHRPQVPADVATNSWVINPIDALVLEQLKLHNVKPSPEADRRTLLRRLSLDLIGLPPTPMEVEAFVRDKSPNAYEKQVDRLLASPHFGERMASPWLDVARFADTVGYHGDQNQNVFPYRDYVIESFNRNKPFDQFTVEQLAGDLLPNPTTEQRVATAFNRLNMMTREGGAQPKEYLAKYAADRVRTVSGAWMGSTMGCAECHDHKYDPFSTKDFYQMEAFFADLKQWGYYADAPYAPTPELAGFANEHPFPPEIQVESPYLKKRMVQLREELKSTQEEAWQKVKADKKSRQAFDTWRDESRAFLANSPDGWLTPEPGVKVVMKDPKFAALTNFTIRPDHTVTFTTLPREGTTITAPLTNLWISAIRVELVPAELVAAGAPPAAAPAVAVGGKAPATKAAAKKQSASPRVQAQAAKAARRRQGKLSDVTLAATLNVDGKDQKLAFHYADADNHQVLYDFGLPVLGVRDMWRVSTNHGLQTAICLLDKPVRVNAAGKLTLAFAEAELESVRISVSPFAAEDPLQAGADAALRSTINSPGWMRSSKQDAAIERAYLLNTSGDTNYLAKTHRLEREFRECRGGTLPVQITESRAPMTIRVLPRGNWQDDSGEVVEPAVPHFLPQPAAPAAGQRLTRLDLARWLVAPENPLTSRVVVNRLWKQCFGMGISSVVDDVGGQGDWPSHPELLDWLACEFQQPTWKSGAKNEPAKHPWDFKHITKVIVMSNTYRQACGPRADLRELDPNNRWLACQSPRRLDAEFVRDNALAVAGLLNYDIGGPSAHPYQPAGYYASLQFPNRDYYADEDDRQYRRGLYTWWQRTFLHPMMVNFDAPHREECTAARNLSNTPQQALTLLNDPTFVEASRVFATRILASRTKSDEARLDLIFNDALARDPKPSELKSLESFLGQQREHYRANKDDACKFLHVGLTHEPEHTDEAELAAWTQVCRVVLNLHETITRY